MTSIQKAQLEFLNETVEFYSKNERCVNEQGICLYHIPGKAGCAIGRHVPDIELRQEFDTFKNAGVDNPTIFSQLPPALKELGMIFIKRIQYLHDEEACWDENG